MRLNLVIQRHGLPVTRILWTTSQPSVFGGRGNVSSSSSYALPASSSVIASTRTPNAAFANGYTIAQLLEDVNGVLPLETEGELVDDEYSGAWGLEDYVVEVGGFECMHFMEVDGLLRDGDEVVIRALQTSDLRARRLSGRHQVSTDGRHLIDGVPFGRPFLKRPTSSRPAIAIPPRKRRRTILNAWNRRDDYEVEDEDWARLEQEYTDKYFKDAYADDGTVIRHNATRGDDEDAQVPESDADVSDFEDEIEDEDGDLQQELLALKEDMEVSGLGADVEGDVQQPSNAGYALRLRSDSRQKALGEGPAQGRSPSAVSSVANQPSPRVDFTPRTLRLRSGSRQKTLSKSPAGKSPVVPSATNQPSRGGNLTPRSLRLMSDSRQKAPSKSPTGKAPSIVSGVASQRCPGGEGSKIVRFQNQDEEQIPPIPQQEEAPVTKEPSIAEDFRGAESGDEASDTTSTASVSSDTSSDEEESTSESDEDSISDTDEDSTSESEEETSESDDDSTSEEEEEADKEATPEVVPKAKLQPRISAPGEGSLRTKKSNRRNKLRNRLAKLKQLGALPPEADFAALRAWESVNGHWYHPPDVKAPEAKDVVDTRVLEKAQEEFEKRRLKLLRQLESGGVHVNGISDDEEDEEQVPPAPPVKENGGKPTKVAEQAEAEPANEAAPEQQPEPPKRRTLDVASSRRLLLGSLGVRTPRSKEDEEATRKKLAGKINNFQSQRRPSKPDVTQEPESDVEVNWQDKLIIKATECVFDDIELSAPPFPFEQRWDSEAHEIIGQRKGWGKKRKRRRRAQVYEEEGWEEEYENGENGYSNGDVELNYDDMDVEQTNNDEVMGDVVEAAVQVKDKRPKSPSADLPALPSDLSPVPDLVEKGIMQGSIIAFKQLDMSKATNWQPRVSEYRVAEVHEVLENGGIKVRLAKRDWIQPKHVSEEDEEEGPREYSGFEMPGFEEDEMEDDGFREVTFGELIDPKLLQAAARVDIVDADAAEPEDAQEVIISCASRDSAQNLPAVAVEIDNRTVSTIDEALDAGLKAVDRKPSVVEEEEALDEIEPPAKRKRVRRDSHDSERSSASQVIRSPRFAGFRSSPAPDTTMNVDDSPVVEATPDRTLAEDEADERPGTPSPVPDDVDSAQRMRYSPMPQDQLDDTLMTEDADETRQRSPSPDRNTTSFDRVLKILKVGRPDASSPPRSVHERRDSSDSSRSPSPASSIIPNPFYKIDKAQEERQRRSSPPEDSMMTNWDESQVYEPSKSISPTPSPPPRKSPPIQRQRQRSSGTTPPNATQVSEVVDLTGSSPPASPTLAGSDEDFAKSNRLPRGPGWVQKGTAASRKPTRLSTSGRVQTLKEVSISPPQKRVTPRRRARAWY